MTLSLKIIMQTHRFSEETVVYWKMNFTVKTVV